MREGASGIGGGVSSAVGSHISTSSPLIFVCPSFTVRNEKHYMVVILKTILLYYYLLNFSIAKHKKKKG